MGAGNSSHAAYFSISNGKICRQFNSPDSETITRVNKAGKTVHEKLYDFIDGKIINIDTKESDYGKSWIITLQDEEGQYALQMPYSSGYSSAFLKTLPNVDLSASVKLIPKLTVEGDKKKTTLFVNQHGKALKHAFTKESPNGLPQMKQQKVKGKLAWDDSDMMEFFDKMVAEDVLPKLKGSKPISIPAGVTADADEEEAPF